MKRIIAKLFGVFVAALPALYASAEVDILSYVLRDLRTTEEVVSLSDYRGSISVLMFFQPECEYCVRQTRVLNRLAEECPGLQPVGIGINGNRANLQREMRQMRADFPVAQINAAFEADIGEVIGTPLLLLSDHDGMLVTWLRGYQSSDSLRALIAKIDAATCGTD